MLVSIAPTLVAKEPTTEQLDSIKLHPIEREHAARFGSIAVQTGGGRIMPINTLAVEVMRGIADTTEIAGHNADQFLLSIFAFPKLWLKYPFIKVANKEFAEKYDLTVGRSAYVDFFDKYGNYYLQAELDRIKELPPNKLDATDIALLEMDNKITLLSGLFFSQNLKLFPSKKDEEKQWYIPKYDTSVFTVQEAIFIGRIFGWYIEEVQFASNNGNWEDVNEILTEIASFQVTHSDGKQFTRKKLMAEIRYNQLEVQSWSRIGLLVGGTLLLLLTLLNRYSRGNHSRNMLAKIFGSVVVISFLYLTVGVALCLYITGFSPSSSTLITYIAWLVVGAGLLLTHRRPFTLPIAALLGGILLTQIGLGLL